MKQAIRFFVINIHLVRLFHQKNLCYILLYYLAFQYNLTWRFPLMVTTHSAILASLTFYRYAAGKEEQISTWSWMDTD